MKTRKILSVVLTLCVLLAAFSLTALAADGAATVGGTGYATLADAIAAAKDGETVTLTADATEDVTIDKNITLDLGTKTLTGTGAASKATLTVAKGATATVKNGTVLGTANGYYTIQNNGTATLEDVTATAGNTGSSMIDNWGTLTITSGTYTGGLNVVKSEEGTTLNIDGGKFTLEYATSGYTGVIFAYGTTTITGGEFIQNLTTTGRWNHPQVILAGVAEGYTSSVKVTGGSFTNKMSGESIFRGAGKATSDNFEVSGGSFNKSISDGYCADGFIPTKNADGTYGVKVGKYVAKIGSTKYETLADAIRLAAKGKTIKLLDDLDISETGLTVAATKTVTLDLNGHALKAANTNTGNIKVLGKLTLCDSTDTAKNGTGTGKVWTDTPYIYNQQDKVLIAAIDGGTFTMESGLIDTASSIEDNDNYGQFAVSVQNENADAAVIINGGHIKAGWYAVAGNGSDVTYNGNITVNGGILESVADYAIYHPHTGTTTVNGGVIFGAAGGISLNRGKLIVNDGTITSKGTGTTGNWGDGTGNQQAAAINVNAAYETTAVEIKGGKITAEKDAILLTNGRNGTVVVSGGSFSSEINPEYCADGFVSTKNEDGTYGVKAAPVAKIGTVEYATLNEAFAAAKDGDTITIVRNFTTDETKTTAADRATVTANVTLDFGSYVMTVPTSLEPTDNFMAILVDGSTLTVEGTTGGIVSGNAEICGVYGFNVKGGGKLVINGGSYYCGITVAQAQLGTIEVNGGSFAVNDGSGKYPGYMFNCVDANYAAGTAGITVNGGTFVGYDPRNNTAEGKGTSFVAPGVGVDAADGSFTAKTGMTAQVMDASGASVKAFATLADAIAAAAKSSTVTLLCDVTENDKADAQILYNLTGVTLDLGGYTYTQKNFAHVFLGTGGVIKNGKMVCDNGSYALFIGDEGETTAFTVDGVEMVGGINIYNASGVVLKNLTVNGTNYYAVWMDSNASATIESGTYTAGDQAVLGSGEQSELHVTGGTFRAGEKELVSANKNGVVAISGGSFTKAVLPEYCAAGFAPAANADGTYGVKEETVNPFGKFASITNKPVLTKDGVTYYPVSVYAGIDSLNYQKVGFKYSVVATRIDGTELNSADNIKETTTVYTTINGTNNAGNAYAYTAEQFDAAYIYGQRFLFPTASFTSAKTTLYVTPFAVTLEGKTVYGTTVELSDAALAAYGTRLFADGN